jgi:glutathione S-transferase
VAPRSAGQPELLLYGNADAPYTVKTVRALRLKRLRFRLIEPQRPEDFQRFSPKTGLLPVLEAGGESIPDSAAILDWLDARFPEPPLIASDPRAARDQRSLEQWVGATFSFYFLRWLRERAAEAGLAPVDGPGPLARMGMLGPDGQIRPEAFDTSDGGPGPEYERRLDDLVTFLGPRPFFHADRISRADLAVFGFLNLLYANLYTDGRTLLEARPALLDHTRRVDEATKE